MDLRNIPYRSDVLAWNPDDLAEYFRTLKYKDCEKVVRKYSINGQRFLNMSENDIQKFPKLRVPIVSKLSQDINRNEGRLSFLPKWAQTQRSPENLGYSQDDGGWSSFDDEDDDDYESPDEDQDKEEADYESPTEDPEEAEHDSDGYEPPPSNNDEAHHNVIFPAKSLPSNTDYIDRPSTTRSSHQPPVPPQRPGPAPAPGPPPFGPRGASLPAFPPPPSNNDLSRDRNVKPLKPPAPSIDRSTKPSLERLTAPFERESPGAGKKPSVPEKPLASQLRSLGEQLAMMPKPPVPPSDRYERGNPPALRKQNPAKMCPVFLVSLSTAAPHRAVPQLCLPPHSSSAVPPKALKPPPKPGASSVPGAESARNLSSTGSLPPRFHLGNNSRSPSRGSADARPPMPIPSRQTVHQTSPEEEEGSLSTQWYVAYVSRPEAEAALRRINKDGTFLVRDSSRKTVTHPYVLMVLYRDKVYNIQIRYQEQDHLYLLGTGLRGNEDFSSVADIIDHFQRTPLLLIDGKDRGSRNQCMLKYAAGHI
ncbi:LCP2 protein, partial [Sakesphorus luctuosus]|nr:LCP2 protein [Sakesphorus luctuosus]